MEFASRRVAVTAVAALAAAGVAGCSRGPARTPPGPPGATIAGRLLSAASDPLAAAAVEVIPAASGPDEVEARDPLAVAQAAADGSFRVPGVPSGRYLLRARAAGHADAETPVTVRAGQDLRVTLTLPRGEILRGDVVDARGAVVPGARVLALPASGRRGEAVTDADGRFAIDRLARGRYRLLVEATGFASAEPPPVDVPGPPARVRLAGAGQTIAGHVLVGGAPAAGARVRLADEDGTSVRETIARDDGSFQFGGLGAGSYAVRATRGALASPTASGIAVEGLKGGAPRPPLRLSLEPGVTIAGRVVDDKGQAIPGASVRVSREAGDPLPELAPAARDGRFQAGPLPPGDYRLIARRPGWVARRSVTARLDPAAPPPPITVELVRGGALAGQVVDARGAAVPAAVVRCLAAGVEDLTVLTEPLPLAAEAAALPPGTGRALGTTRTVRTDAAGRFEIGDLLPGRFRIEVARAGAVPLQTGELAVGPGQRVDAGTLTMRDGLPVEGRVVDEEGTPVGGARVAVRSAGPGAGGELGLYAITDAAGRFTFALAPGRYLVAAGAAGLSDRTAPLELAAGARPQPLELKLARADAALEGLVKDDGGRPLARARVAARAADEGPLGSAVTDAGGHFTIGRLPRRALLLQVSHPDYPVTERPATPGTLAVLTVPIPGRVDGEVRERVTGAAVARARVEASGPDGRPATAAMRGRTGGFTLSHLVPGRWRVRASAPGFTPAEREVEVPPSTALGEPSVRDLRLELDAAK